MNCKLKALSLAFVALVAMSALVAGAQAKSSIQLTAAQYPATLEGTGENIGENFNTEGGKITCKVSHYTSTLTEANSTITVAPDYTPLTSTNCGFSPFGSTINTEGCHYVLTGVERPFVDNYRSTFSITCPAGKSIKIVAGPCEAEIKPQSNLSSVDIVDMTGSPGDITIQPTVWASNPELRNGKNGPIAYTVTKDGFGCPFNGTGNKTGGEYSSTGAITAIATSPANTQVDLQVSGS